MKATRREALMGALAVPAAAGVPVLRGAGGPVVLYDPTLAPPPIADARAIAGDRIRFARAVFDSLPEIVVGLSRHADALLIADVGREAGYRPVTPPAGLGEFGWALART